MKEKIIFWGNVLIKISLMALTGFIIYSWSSYGKKFSSEAQFKIDSLKEENLILQDWNKYYKETNEHYKYEMDILEEKLIKTKPIEP